MTKEPDYTTYYNRWSGGDPRSLAAHYQPYLRSLDIPLNARILDIGCGQGAFLLALQQAGYTNIQGVDVSETQVDVARKFTDSALCVSDIPCWLAAQHDFDYVFMFDVLEHIPVHDQVNFLGTIRRKLSEAGLLFCRVPNANSAFASRYRWGDWTHHCSFTEDSLAFVLSGAGFEMVTIVPDDFGRLPHWVPRPKLSYFLRILFRGVRRLGAIGELGYPIGKKIPLSPNIIAKARVC